MLTRQGAIGAGTFGPRIGATRGRSKARERLQTLHKSPAAAESITDPARDREMSRQAAGPTCKDCTAHAASSAGYSAHFAFSNVRSS